MPTRREPATSARDAALSRAMRDALREYPVPSLDAARGSRRERRRGGAQLASLGYVSAGAAPVVREDAPRPADMRRSSTRSSKASTCSCARSTRRSIPLLRRILAEDRTTSTPRCAWPRRTRRSGRTRARRAAFEHGRARSPPARRTSASTARCTTRRAASGRAPFRSSSRSSRRSPTGCPRSRRWRWCASGRAGPPSDRAAGRRVFALRVGAAGGAACGWASSR